MNTTNTFYSNDLFLTTRAELESTVISTLNAECTVAAGLDSMLRGFLVTNTPAEGETTDWELYCAVVGDIGAAWWDSVRLQLLSDWIDQDNETTEDTKWTDLPGFSKCQSGFSSFRQKVARQTGGFSFEVATKWKLQDFENAADPTSGFKVTTPKAIVEKVKKPAAGKSKAATAKGADIPSAESGATMLETLTGDIHLSEAAVLQALKAFPQLVTRPAIRRAFQAAVDTVDKKKAAKKATAKKAA